MTGTQVISTLQQIRRSYALLCVIVLVGIALRIYCFHGLWGTDDAEYASLAHAMSQNTFQEFVQENYIDQFKGPAHIPLRMGLIFPLSLLLRIFGINEWTLVAYPLFISILGILLAYGCGRLIFGVGAGLIAAGIWAVIPIDYWYATSFLPDLPASFYASLGVAIVFFVMNISSAKKGVYFWGGIAGGLFFGISWLCKESVVYLIPFCAILIYGSMKKDRKSSLLLWGGVAVAALTVLIGEMVTYYYLKGDFLLRLHENERSFEQTKAYLFYEGSRFGWPEGSSHLKALVKRLFLEGPQTIILNQQLLFLPAFGLIASAYALFWKEKKYLYPALWMLVLIGMYNFSSCSFASYTPLVLYDRYLHPIMLPATLLTSGLIINLFNNTGKFADSAQRREKKFWGLILVVLLIGIIGNATFRNVRHMERTRLTYDTKEVAAFVRPTDMVYTDPLSQQTLEFYFGYPGKTNIHNYEDMKAEDIPARSYVLVDNTRLNWLKVNVSMWLTKEYGYHRPDFADNPPKNWKVKWKNANACLYLTQ